MNEIIENDYDVDLLTRVIEYNHFRYLANKEGIEFEENKEYEKILKARYQKISRIKKRFMYLLTRYDYVWFCTFTFSNDYINKCTRTKRDLIKSVIDTYDFKYILNIDYGKKTEREHYHCVLATNWNMDVNQYFQSHYPCHCLAINCKKGRDDFETLSKYINKLTNHCIKATTKRQRLLYNFRGYDNFCPTERDKKLVYLLDTFSLFEYEKVGLLDKAHITGKNLTQILLSSDDTLFPGEGKNSQCDELPIIDFNLT